MAVPGLTPVTIPEERFTVATAGFDDTQVPPAEVEKNWVVDPTQAVWVPLRVPADGAVTTEMPFVTVLTHNPPPVGVKT